MKHLQLIVFSFILTLFSCEIRNYDPKNIVDKDYDLSSFSGIDIENAIIAKVVEAPKTKVSVTGDKYDLDNLSVKVRNGVLVVKCLNNRRFTSSKIEIFIETPSLNSVDLSGAAKAVVKGFPLANKLIVNLSGASNLELRAPYKLIIGELSGASNVQLDEPADKIDFQLSGASTLDAFNANSKEAYLDLSGASEADISVSEFLKVDASGASKIRYKGTPKIEQSLSGSSRIIKY